MVIIAQLVNKGMNARAAGRVGISIYQMLIMRSTNYCDHCSREYLLELMIQDLCLRCFNQDARLKVKGLGLRAQGRKAQEFISQDSRAGQSISCEKKAQGSRTKP